MSQNKKVKKGQRVTVNYENRQFEVIVIDPNGLGKDQPSIGFGQNMMEKHGGLPQPTISKWIKEGDSASDSKILKTPTGKSFRVITINGLDNNIYQVLEISDWVAVAIEALKAKGKSRLSDTTRDKLLNFLGWFAVKGLYADVYTVLKGFYTARDNRSLSKWMLARSEGIVKRNKYTDFLKDQGCEGYEYGNWTNYIYEGLFGKTAREIKELWEVVEGSEQIARNYISKEEGLKAVAYCENQTVELHIEDLRDSHDDAIYFTRRKFKDALPELD